MAAIAEFRVPAHDTALGTTFENIPSLVCELEQAIAADDLGIWMREADLSAINSALEADSTVDTYSIIMDDRDGWLYNIEFSDEISELFSVVVEEGGTILTATAANRMWTIQLRFSAQENIRKVYDRLTEHGVQVDITQIQSFTKITADEIGLTSGQHEALTAAIQHGYFEIPREISLEELAAKLEISHQSLSERLRRAHHSLIISGLEITEKGTANTHNMGCHN